MRPQFENLFLLTLQSVSLGLSFVILKINSENFSIEEIGLLSFIIAKIAILSNLRLSGIDQLLSRYFIAEEKIDKNLILLSLAFSIIFITSATLLYLTFFPQNVLPYWAILLFCISLCLDRSSSLWLSSKQFIKHRTWALLPPVAVSALAAYALIANMEFGNYILHYLLINAIFNFARASLSLRSILAKLDQTRLLSRTNKKPVFNILFFSLIGFGQALTANADKILIADKSLSLLGELTIGLSGALAVYEVFKALLLKNIYVDAESLSRNPMLFRVRNLKAAYVILFIFLTTFISIVATNFIFGGKFEFSISFATAGALYILILSFVSWYLGLTGLVSSVSYVGKLSILVKLSHLIFLFVFLELYQPETITSLMWAITTSSFMSIIIIFILHKYTSLFQGSNFLPARAKNKEFNE